MSINYVAFLAQVAVLETLYAMMMCLSPKGSRFWVYGLGV